MVLQKRLYYGFEGYQAPPVPRANRSLRRRGPLIRKKVVDNQMYAFDLLATVADKILLDGKSPGTASSDRIFKEGGNLSIVKEERLLDDHKLLNIESCTQSNSEIGLVVVECGSKAQNQPYREITKHQSGFSSGSASALTTSSCMAKAGFDEKKALNNGSSQSGSLPKKLERSSSGYTVFGVPIFGDHGKKQFQSHISEASYGVGSDTCSSEDPKLLDRNLSASDKNDTDVKVPVHGTRYTCDFPSPCRNNVNLVTKDDDDNSSECSQRSTVMKTIADRRIRKLLASRCWRAPPKANSDRKRGSKCQRSQRIYPFKKRKLLYTSTSPSTSDDTTRCDYEDIYEPLEKATDMPTSGFGVSARKATSELSGAAGQSTLFASRESNVKLRIKSFRVPELFIELPETATVGSLKKTVMDAITTLLGGGLRIGVLVQGRKIRDDNRTLLQTGISHDNKVDTLGFTLEPNPSRVLTPLCSEEPSIEVLRPLSSSYAESSIEKGAADSKALIAVPEPNEQPLAIVPPPLHKSKRSEAAQRRIRRPFSVAEVEALVQAVEKLGTGRWRDVKIRAFDDVDHRTYVDLKDKWKTLVHTATISPQQRRGEPVPQDLLDRVLAAHSYWSLQHAKQQPERCLLV